MFLIYFAVDISDIRANLVLNRGVNKSLFLCKRKCMSLYDSYDTANIIFIYYIFLYFTSAAVYK